MQEHEIVSIDIDRDWRELYQRIWHPKAFLEWASGLCGAGLTPREDGSWGGEGMEGPLRVRFTPHNEFGVLDYWVSQAGEPEIYTSLRVVPNGAGALAMLVLFRWPGLTETMLAAEAEWARRDLESLKEWVERAAD